MRVGWCCVLVRIGNASSRGAPLVGPTVLVGHRLKVSCGKLVRHFDCAAPLLKAIRSTGDAADCHEVVWGGRTGSCSVVDGLCCLVGVRAWVESKHMYLIHTWKCGSLALFLPIRRRMKKEKREKHTCSLQVRSLPGTWCSACKHPIDYYTNQRYGRLSCA